MFDLTSLSRRRFLNRCGIGLFGLSLPHLLSLPRTTAAGAGKAKSCILLYCWGGVSQLETWDPKPDAPAEVRGDYRPIATATPGLALANTCRCWPVKRNVWPSFVRYITGRRRTARACTGT